MDLSIIVVAYNVKDLVQKCLSKVTASSDTLSKEIIYVDNGSTDGTVEMVGADFPGVILIRNSKNLGFGKANNIGFEKAHGEFILMLNADAFIGPDALQKTVGFMRDHPEAGILGACLIGQDGKIQPSARSFPTPWRDFMTKLDWGRKFPRNPFLKGIDDLQWDHQSIRETEWVPGCFLMARRKMVEELGFLLRKDFFMYHEDADLCLRAKRKKWKVYFFPEKVLHLGGASSGRFHKTTSAGRQILKYQAESRLLYYRKNYNILFVMASFLFTLLFTVLQSLKRYILGPKDAPPSDAADELQISFDLLIKTRFGSTPFFQEKGL